MDLGILTPIFEFVDAHFWTLFAFVMGLQLGLFLGFRKLHRALTDHQHTLREFVQLLGHFEACAEVLEENDLADDARERGNRYAQSNLIELETSVATAPSRLDRLRDRLPF